MKSTELAFRYARAFFSLQKEGDDLEKIEDDLHSLSVLAQQEPHFLDYLKQSQIQIEEKKAFLEKLHVEKNLIPFLLYLIEKGRIQYLSQIASQFRTLLLEKKGIQEVSVLTASALSPTQSLQLQNSIERLSQKKSLLKTRIDPTLIAGLVLTIGHRQVDFSLKWRLKRLKQALYKGVQRAA